MWLRYDSGLPVSMDPNVCLSRNGTFSSALDSPELAVVPTAVAPSAASTTTWTTTTTSSTKDSAATTSSGTTPSLEPAPFWLVSTPETWKSVPWSATECEIEA